MLNAKKLKVISTTMLTGYLGLLLYWMFFGFSRSRNETFMYNLTPFSTIKNYFTYYDHFPLSIWIINIAGNIGVFIPFGILLPIVFPRLTNVFKFTITFLIGIFILEMFQLISKLGSFDIDDIILNTVGALIGFIFYTVGKRRRRAKLS